jgi:hypothetical protein
MEMVSNSAIGNEFEDQKQLTAGWGSAAIESDKVWVVEMGKDFNFIYKLLNPFVDILVQTLYCNYTAVP